MTLNPAKNERRTQTRFRDLLKCLMAETAVSANVFFLEMPIPLNLRGSLEIINHNLMSKCYTVFFLGP